ncbi:uncharacterized protein G2W53_041197 [Senna tora]|uniref:Uncharacterized protein n=1 Tax=Senna tora TaxID=362788 RepID=A0A834W148_9FABA|nr:uncharacterized protein G2W53_041197 [Senna tora]
MYTLGVEVADSGMSSTCLTASSRTTWATFSRMSCAPLRSHSSLSANISLKEILYVHPFCLSEGRILHLLVIVCVLMVVVCFPSNSFVGLT